MRTESIWQNYTNLHKIPDTLSLLATIEPLTGNRIADVFDQRRKIEFALHFQKVARSYPEAEKILVILDNLNTHNASSFYEVFPAEEAFRLSQKFEFIYTPKAASWLNMIEIEFSAISRLCLNRRIPSKELLAKEVSAIVKERTAKKLKSTGSSQLKPPEKN